MIIWIDYCPLPKQIVYAQHGLRAIELIVPPAPKPFNFLDLQDNFETTRVVLKRYCCDDPKNGFDGWFGYDIETQTVVIGSVRFWNRI